LPPIKELKDRKQRERYSIAQGLLKAKIQTESKSTDFAKQEGDPETCSSLKC
jgi:hypothetical protein